jgi:hypothetical protein
MSTRSSSSIWHCEKCGSAGVQFPGSGICKQCKGKSQGAHHRDSAEERRATRKALKNALAYLGPSSGSDQSDALHLKSRPVTITINNDCVTNTHDQHNVTYGPQYGFNRGNAGTRSSTRGGVNVSDILTGKLKANASASGCGSNNDVRDILSHGDNRTHGSVQRAHGNGKASVFESIADFFGLKKHAKPRPSKHDARPRPSKHDARPRPYNARPRPSYMFERAPSRTDSMIVNVD